MLSFALGSMLKAACFLLFNFFLPLISWAQISSLKPYSETLSLSVPPFMWRIEIHTINKLKKLHFCVLEFLHCRQSNSGPGSVVGIETVYGQDGPGIESRWGRDFPHLSSPALRPTNPPVQLVPGLSRG
jgi:hypothetical protein